MGFAHSGCAQAPAGGVFERYDRDGDGKVTKAELRNAQTSERFDANRDGAITQAEYNQVAGGAAAAPTPAPAVGAPGAGQAMEWFTQTDRDKDGRLSQAEANSPRFKELDTDADGFVTLAEYKAFLRRAALKQLDTDGDVKISQTEFNAFYQDSGHYFRTRQREAQPADGRALPNPLPVKADPLGLRFAQDYVPGTKDPQGRRLAATEANQLVAHRRQLFASFGATYHKPPTPDPDFQGFGVLRKETATGPWQGDLDLGLRPYRVEVMASVVFTTDGQGRKLDPPAPRLVAARWSPNHTILVRDDASAAAGGVATWNESTVAAGPALPPGSVFTARSFGSHVDRQTGVHHLFAGTWTGQSGAGGEYRSAIYRAAYDPATTPGLVWAPEPELPNVGRIMAMVECNGDLYASCHIFDDTPLSGGVFRRVDGPQPRWEQAYRWQECDLTVWDDEPRMLRGLTAVPDPSGIGREVLIGFRFFPEPVIERIDPQQDHKVSVELNLKDFFGQAFHGGGRYTWHHPLRLQSLHGRDRSAERQDGASGRRSDLPPRLPEPAAQGLALPDPAHRRHRRMGSGL